MKLKRMWMPLIFGVLAMLAVAGCKSSRDDSVYGEPGGDNVGTVGEYDPNELGLSPRGEFGTPVTDVAFENVQFPYDSFQIADSELGKIEKVADYMNSHNDVSVVIDGHCDERGSQDYNLTLGEHRALAVRAYLISLGTPGDKIQTRSFGEENPLDPGHTPDAWRINRRCEFSLYRQ